MPQANPISFRVVNSDKVQKQLRMFIQNFPRVVAEAAKEAIEIELIPEIKNQIKANDSIFTGKLYRSIGVEVTVNSKGAFADVGAFGIPYATAVEYGQSPGTTQDYEKLVSYARIKLGIDPKKAKKVGWALKKTIEKKGSKPHPFIRPVISRRRHLVRGLFERLLWNKMK